MAQRVIQSSFNVGEIAPSLYARTDIAKYHSAAALIRNFFVDYRGGVSTRPGTQFITQCYKSNTTVRLIPFQASGVVDYVLEFGDGYIRFINNKAPVLEAAQAITAVAGAALTIPANNYAVNDWIYVAGNYYAVSAVAGQVITVAGINGAPLPSLAKATSAARVYTLPSPYTAAELALVKFAQSVSAMTICHPNHPPMILTLVTATNWTLTNIVFGSSANPPANVKLTSYFNTSGNQNGGAIYTCSYTYVVTAVDSHGQESAQSTAASIIGQPDIRVWNGTIRVAWAPVVGVSRYNVYRSDIAYYAQTATGTVYGYMGSSNGVEFDDSNIAPNFDQTPPVAQNPFAGSGIAAVIVNNPGTYTAVPTVTSDGAPTTNPTYIATLQATTYTLGAGGSGYAVNDNVVFTNGITLVVASVTTDTTVTPNVTGIITSFLALAAAQSNPGIVSSGGVPANPLAQTQTTGLGTGATISATWGVGQVVVQTAGGPFTNAPNMIFAPAGATATAYLQPASNGNPSVPGFFQQRLFLGGAVGSPAGFNFSQPGSYYNFNISKPSEPDDAISGTLVSGQLNSIKSLVATSSGLIVFTDRATWLINGGQAGAAITPSAIVANPQSYEGANDMPPIVSNFDILYVQQRGSIVRDCTYNIYANVYTGSDISALSSHLFYGHQLLEWAYAEEPFKLIWAVRDDGVLLCLTFLKEQEFTAWAHADTTGGLFKSIASVTEVVGKTTIDAVYTVVQRSVNGNTVQYIERLAERLYSTKADPICVDAALIYNGAASATFSGAQHLAGLTVTGLADGAVIPPFVMPASGAFTLPMTASRVTVGVGFVAQLQTLALDVGEPTIQSKMKKINAVTLRVNQTLGLKIGSAFSTLVVMKDTALGYLSSMANGIITDLVSNDVRTILDPTYTVPGQYCVQQDQPYPATVLGVIPDFVLGDTDARR